MRKAVRILLAVLAVLALAVWYFVFTAVAVPAKARFALDLAALRAAAGPVEAVPEKAFAEEVARAQIPAVGVVVGGGGQGLGNFTFGFYAWQFVYADGTSAVVDAVHSPAIHAAQYGGQPYRPEGWEHQTKALGDARFIAVTHEHHDHVGGIADAPDFAKLGPALRLTAAQHANPPFGGVGHSVPGTPALESGPEGSLHPIGPGLVAISAAGHTPGSQMIYARLKGGRELLFLGDIAWQHQNLTEAKTRARLTSLVMHEDAQAVTHQLRAILDFRAANPGVDIVISHDIAEMEQRFASGAVGKGLR
jgi:glyoxylase-like metal-dependent hydrolase (beta-lactamase superfamily II)